MLYPPELRARLPGAPSRPAAWGARIIRKRLRERQFAVRMAAAQPRTQPAPALPLLHSRKRFAFVRSSMKGPLSARQGEPAAAGVAVARAGMLSAFDIGTTAGGVALVEVRRV